MREQNRAQHCALRIGRARLAYAFVPNVGTGGTVKAFTHSGACVFTADSAEISRMVRAVRNGTLKRPGNVARVETSYAADRYDGIFMAMWLLGRLPVVPHRSHTYCTKRVRYATDGLPESMTHLLHRFVFDHGRLATGLSRLITNVYGVTPEILAD